MKHRRKLSIFMRHNKYLQNIGIPKHEIGLNNYTMREHLKLLHIRERYLYGMDSRETYDLSRTYMEWLYTRLSMYKYQAGKYIDLSYHKFKYEGTEYTFEELIDKILDLCKVYFEHIRYNSVEILNSSWKPDISSQKEEAGYKAMQEAAQIFALILPALWW